MDKTPANQTKSGDFDYKKYSLHLVAVIDFLGQTDQLLRWDMDPQTDEERAIFREAVGATMERVHRWRGEFRRLFTFHLASIKEPPSVVPIYYHDHWRELSNFDLNINHFSDSLIIDCPIKSCHGHISCINVFPMIMTCGALMLEALSEGVAFRGGLDIGMLGRFDTGDCYGPAVAKAHWLESKAAEFPRFLVGDSLLQFLCTYAQKQTDVLDDVLSKCAHEFSLTSLSMLAKDVDGHHIVNYMKFAMFDAILSGEIEDGAHRIASACEFVQSQIDVFKSQQNSKLLTRYERLLNYLNLSNYFELQPAFASPSGKAH